jgi:hypothetical protein
VSCRSTNSKSVSSRSLIAIWVSLRSKRMFKGDYCRGGPPTWTTVVDMVPESRTKIAKMTLVFWASHIPGHSGLFVSLVSGGGGEDEGGAAPGGDPRPPDREGEERTQASSNRAGEVRRWVGQGWWHDCGAKGRRNPCMVSLISPQTCWCSSNT